MLKTVATIDAKSSTRDCKPAAGEEVLVHDGKTIIVRHGPEAYTGCGNPAYVMVRGTKKEIDAEVKRLKLSSVVLNHSLLPTSKSLAETEDKD